MSAITLLSWIIPSLTLLISNHAVLEAAHSPAECRSKSIYRQHKYSANMIIQAKGNIFQDWKCILL